jgi:hypothetical protein
MQKMYKLMESSEGYFVIHTKGLTKAEADEMRERHAGLFPESTWLVKPHNEDDDMEQQSRHYNDRAVDGWEDIYNYD